MKNQLMCKSIMRTFYFFISLLFFIACNQHDTKTTPVKKMTADDSLRIKLLGRWGNREAKDRPVWDISPDSIYYYERKTAYHYKIENGDFIIDYSESKFALRHVSVIKDTMFFFDDEANMSIRADRLP